MKKRILCFAMVLAISLFAIPTVAENDFSVYIGDTGYATLDEAIDAANLTSGAVIDVRSDINRSGDGVPYTLKSSMTIDFNDHLMSLTGNQAFALNGKGITSTIKNGKLIMNQKTYESHFLFRTISSDISTTLNVEDFTIEMNNAVPSNYGCFCVSDSSVINVRRVQFKYTAPYTSTGALFSFRAKGNINVYDSSFSLCYHLPVCYSSGSSGYNLKIYSGVFNGVEDFAATNSQITDRVGVIASSGSVTDNEYKTGFAVNCKHSFEDDCCEYCGAIKSDYGDCNNDKCVNAKDLFQLKGYLVRGIEPENKINADINADGRINAKDILHLKKYLADIIVSIEPIKAPDKDNGKRVKIKQFSFSTPGPTSNVNDTAALMLPKNYSNTGTPTRLVIDCHGYSYSVSNTTLYEGRFNWVDMLVHDGYAVLECTGLSYAHCGGSLAIKSYINAYKYAIQNYNFYDEVFVNGNSMGGITSINLVCSGEIPVIAHSLHYPITSTYRQTYTEGWSDGLRRSVGRYNEFEYPDDYTHSTFPYTNARLSPTEAELQLYADNFFSKIATKYSVFRYTNILNSTQSEFSAGFERFLSETNSTAVTAMYEKIKVNYPVPVYFQQSENDGIKTQWSKYLVDAINRADGCTATYKWFSGSAHGGCIGPQITVLADDGTQLTLKESGYNIAECFKSFK